MAEIKVSFDIVPLHPLWNFVIVIDVYFDREMILLYTRKKKVAADSKYLLISCEMQI